MKYRKFGNLGWDVSVLGFGAMRLPIIDQDNKKIDKPLATKMIRHAIDSGVNYVDTAFIYHGGQSEPFIGEVLKDGYREKVKLATKMPSWSMNTAEDFDNVFNQQLINLNTETIDCYLLHGLNDERWLKLKDLGVVDWAEKKKAEGKIKHIGFSFHDHLDVFKQILDENDKWDFCQIQYNYMDTEFQAGKEGLELAADKGLAVIVMEPLRGGQLVNNTPQAVQEIWSRALKKQTKADWALQWIWNQPAVSTILSGMSTMEQIVENLESADKAQVNSFSQEELDLVEEVSAEYRKTTPIDCTRCKYCLPCQVDIDIPEIFQRYNDAFRYDDMAKAQRMYQLFMADRQADRCEECYECEDQCPQELAIVEWLKTCHDAFTQKQ